MLKKVFLCVKNDYILRKSKKGGIGMNFRKIKSRMVEGDINMQRLARELDISKTALNSKMKGRTEFKLSELRKMKSLLNIQDQDFLDIFLN